jgi:hypothetical protein
MTRAESDVESGSHVAVKGTLSCLDEAGGVG